MLVYISINLLSCNFFNCCANPNSYSNSVNDVIFNMNYDEGGHFMEEEEEESLSVTMKIGDRRARMEINLLNSKFE